MRYKPVRLVVLACGVLAGLIIAAIWVAWPEDGEAVRRPELRLGYKGDGFTVWLVPGYQVPAQQAVIVAPDGSPPFVELLDLDTGNTVARVETSFKPHALLRPTRQELLLTDQFTEAEDAGLDSDDRLLVLDIANGLRLKRQIELPGRSNGRVYLQAMALSADGRLLVYHARDDSQYDRQGCPGESPLCARHFAGVVDLDTRPMDVRLVHYGDHVCGPPHASGDWLAVASCEPPLGDRLINLRTGEVTAGTSVAGSEAPPAGYLELGNAVAALAIDGTIYDATGTLDAEPALPAGTTVPAGAAITRADRSRILVPYTHTPGSAVADGVVVYSARERRREADIALTGATSVIPRADGTWLVMHNNGGLALFDYRNGSTHPLTHLERYVPVPGDLLSLAGPGRGTTGPYLVP
jgi:hypothetical protein